MKQPSLLLDQVFQFVCSFCSFLVGGYSVVCCHTSWVAKIGEFLPRCGSLQQPLVVVSQNGINPEQTGLPFILSIWGCLSVGEPLFGRLQKKTKGQPTSFGHLGFSEKTIRRRGPLWHHCLQPCPIRGVGNVPMVTTYLDPQNPPFFSGFVPFFFWVKGNKKGSFGGPGSCF